MKVSMHLLALWAVDTTAVVARVLADAAIVDASTKIALSDPLSGIDLAFLGKNHSSLASLLEMLAPRHKPTSIEEAMARAQLVATESQGDIVKHVVLSVSNGLFAGSIQDVLDQASGFKSEESGHDNINPDPLVPVYPRVADDDAPYSNTEQQLRSAIFVPKTFTYGEKPPVILHSGTGLSGYETYRSNLIGLLQDEDWADPVWINVPGNSLGDVQSNAEYTAYALNYIAALTQRNVSVIGISQASINIQWALKYWPSTRKVTSTNVVVSSDYKGTRFISLITPLGLSKCPAFFQQGYLSRFIRTLRANGGDSAYIPTTSIYSAFIDEVVQPQTGPDASAIIDDSRHVGVSNNELQIVCKGYPAGSFYTHTTTGINPLTFALIKDAITHGEAGSISRLDLGQVCSTYLIPGLDLLDLLEVFSLVITAIMRNLLYYPVVYQEPPIKSYAAVPLS